MNKLVTSKEQVLSDLEQIKTELLGGDKLKKETMEMFMKNLKKQSGAVTEFDERVWLSMIDYVTVNSKEDIRVTFKNGITVKA